MKKRLGAGKKRKHYVIPDFALEEHVRRNTKSRRKKKGPTFRVIDPLVEAELRDLQKGAKRPPRKRRAN